MSHSIRIDSKSALVGVAAAFVCVVAMGQVSVSRATTPTAAIAPGYGIGNPHPRDMVQLASATAWDSQSILFPANAEHEVFVVPTDKWLVLLPNHANDSTSVPFHGHTGSPAPNAHLYQDLNGVYTYKAGQGSNKYSAEADAGPNADTVGWTFAPGSRVVLRNHQAASLPNGQLTYNFFGYLTGL